MTSVVRRLGFYVTDITTRKGRLTSFILYVLNAVFILLFVLSTFSVGEQVRTIITYTEVVIALIFAGEYFLRLFVADSWKQEIRDPYMIADAIAVFPTLLIGLPIGVDTGFLRGLHTLRVFRFLRFGFEGGTFFTVEIDRKRLEQIRFVTIILLLFFIYAGFMYGVESGVNENLNNMGDALYFSAVTLTTLGYGDILPTTPSGRALTTIFLVVGAVLIPWQAFRIRNADKFITDVVCEKCGLDKHAENARWCYRCGHPIHEQDDFARGEDPTTDTLGDRTDTEE